MTSRERILAVLRGERPDLVPVFPKIAFSNVISCPGMTVREYMTNPESMAEAAVRARATFGWDGVALHTDIGSEGRALGSVYEQPENEPSRLVKRLLGGLDEYEKIVTPDPKTALPMRTVIEALKIVKRRIGDEAYVLAWTNGPLNVASQVLTMEDLLIAMTEEPEKLHRLLERCLLASVAYARELVAAGTDAVAFGHALASTSVISRIHYAEFAFPYEKRLVAAIHEAGARAFTHICGRIEPIADLIAETGTDVVDFDHLCDYGTLLQLAPGKVLRGNIAPELLVFGTEGEIRESVRKLLSTASSSGKLLLGSGCEIALNTPVHNLHAFVKAGREFGTQDNFP